MRNQSNLEFFRDVESFFDSADQKEALTRKRLECTGLIAAERNTMSHVNGQWRERLTQKERKTKRERQSKRVKARKMESQRSKTETELQTKKIVNER